MTELSSQLWLFLLDEGKIEEEEKTVNYVLNPLELSTIEWMNEPIRYK
jgi:hypothetical protein